MIVGVGTDIVGIARVARIVEGPRGEAFLRRVLTEEERRLLGRWAEGSPRRAEFAAGRWAAKEAAAKALGCGIGRELGFGDIEILPDGRGRPVCRVAREIAAGVRLHVSIAHADGWACAFAVAESP